MGIGGVIGLLWFQRRLVYLDINLFCKFLPLVVVMNYPIAFRIMLQDL